MNNKINQTNESNHIIINNNRFDYEKTIKNRKRQKNKKFIFNK